MSLTFPLLVFASLFLRICNKAAKHFVIQLLCSSTITGIGIMAALEKTFELQYSWHYDYTRFGTMDALDLNLVLELNAFCRS